MFFLFDRQLSRATLSKSTLLLLYCVVDVKALFEQGKGYPWPVLPRCPCCGGRRLWGHGYAPRYFQEYYEPLWVKRLRCPDCHSVHTFRPQGYWGRYRTPCALILLCLLQKILYGRWLWCIERQSQQYWYRRLRWWSSGHETVRAPTVAHLTAFAAHQSATAAVEEGPHLSFAATAPR